jgi:hypothetical protein
MPKQTDLNAWFDKRVIIDTPDSMSKSQSNLLKKKLKEGFQASLTKSQKKGTK